MVRRFLGAGLLLGVLVALPAGDLFAQKKKKGDPKKEAPPADSSKLKSGDFVGTLNSVPGTDRKFTLEFDQKTLVPDKGGKGGGNAGRALQLQNQLTQAQAQMARARTPQQRAQAANRLAQVQRSIAQMQGGGGKGGAPAGYKYQTKKQEIEFQLSEGVKVRSLSLGERFDEKGNPKKWTKAELAAARGKDSKLPGYESSLDKLEVGQKVKVTLAPAPAKKGAVGAKDAEDEAKDSEKKMQVKLIVILGEADKDAPPSKGKKK